MTDLTLESLLQRLMNRLAAAPKTRDEPWRTPGLATLDTNGFPSLRTVVLRGYEDNYLEFHTDIRSAKWEELTKESSAAWCFWDPQSKEQLRIQGRCILHHQDALTAQIWESLPSHTQASYGASSAPSTSIEAAEDFEFIAELEQANFGVIRCAATSMDWLQLGRPKHKRAQFTLDNSWQGRWVVP